ncbi:MAG TPA: endonuclease/exonuclease/phosphatase family protein [Pseudonocardiaceae bacterium]|nr:endonuclease/exonuclease/phosphatase family protein [Pseudonocardiaceae bacterium]
MLVLQILAALFAVFVLFRLTGVDGNRHTAALLALTPLFVPVGLIIGGLLLGFGQWGVGGGALGLTVLLGALVLPRAIPSRQPALSGRRLRVLASNLYLGRGDVKTIVELVREHQVDVLNLVELTQDAAEELARAGLFELLPHRVLQPVEAGRGSGIAARYPLAPLDLPGPALLEQPSARIEIDSAVVEVVAVHPVPPTGDPQTWKAEMGGLPAARSDGPIRILAGDFNGTLDHGTFRRLLRTGYHDAAAQRGAGLRRTWPSAKFPPPVTIDHVLVDRRAAVAEYRVFDVPNSDHKAVFAELVLPG